MKVKLKRALEKIKSHPVPSDMSWDEFLWIFNSLEDIEVKLTKKGCILFKEGCQPAVFDRTHGGRPVDKGAIATAREFLERAEY
jgi:hypothetical protein